ncbi:MAG: hypothetical protein WA906_06650 [Pacificimonas sp.]
MSLTAPNANLPTASSFECLLADIDDRARAAVAPLVGAAAGNCDQPDKLVADAVHFLTILHAELPSLIDVVGARDAELEGRLEPAANAFNEDRRWLADLAIATGPHTDLADLTTAETTVRAIRDSMLTLGESTRDGCAEGGLLTFLIDWPTLRAALDGGGTLAFSHQWPSPPTGWPDTLSGDVADSLEVHFAAPATARALGFGAQQVSMMHAQMFELVAARAAVRRAD